MAVAEDLHGEDVFGRVVRPGAHGLHDDVVLTDVAGAGDALEQARRLVEQQPRRQRLVRRPLGLREHVVVSFGAARGKLMGVGSFTEEREHD